jgi:hypothetical protein
MTRGSEAEISNPRSFCSSGRLATRPDHGVGATETQHPRNLGDAVGIMNLSAYHRGMMGGSTPNLDRIAGGKTD